jgi:hypothetical protein
MTLFWNFSQIFMKNTEGDTLAAALIDESTFKQLKLRLKPKIKKDYF